MIKQNSHKDAVERQFGDQANAYLTSAVHAQGKDLQRLTTLLQPHGDARLLDLGCGAGHASFTAAAVVKSVVSYDLSAQMLQVVSQAASDKKLTNIEVKQGIAESLPFDDQSFDIVISRYSAHHWHDVGQALREVKRVLRPGGKIIFMDVVSPGHPVLDIYLQTVEVLRDTSHVRNYAPGEWLALFTDAGLVINEVTADRLYLEFSSWIARMRTPEYFAIAIRELQKSASDSVINHYEIQTDGSFTSDIMMIVAKRN
ncbi:sam-dependent methyltransferase YafE [Yersinia frederiksenii]|uniref:Sam-dependent methyltransferase YafE n=2 Tax=Yersinia frederiksenii TaxID=29484 RepID=A0A380PYV4_YERFR|nr:class I SAM-dependent methyltransferase [Yersinia frederiksenii]ATM96925.1 class I SAM-dependent methyltransferase [Yersinia frederiksenii]EEQ15542.1 Methyltransferase type 11 [Yersinia frederiksenii ATCC 33641]KGA45555.1 S-adenosyl-L-methionine-dependent methyltransferase family protein [Yersinia frederiksenii ATCC 33641]CNF54959.1 sam-dependent methyltransferase YafE [Yersinia frederiksenii]SUP78701.1 sam-dependent methyltransferase YafE [Yersinia frederiksenii]